MCPAYRGEDTYGLGIHLKSQFPFGLCPVDGRVSGCIDANIGAVRLEKVPDQFEMMDRQVFPGQKPELVLRISILQLSQRLTQLSVGAGDEDLHSIQGWYSKSEWMSFRLASSTSFGDRMASPGGIRQSMARSGSSYRRPASWSRL